MKRAYLQIRKIFDLHGPCIISKYYNIKSVFWIFRCNELTQCHRHFFRRRDAIFSIQDHRMRNIDHQHRRSLRSEIRFADCKIIFLQLETLDSMIDLRISNGSGKVDLLDHIPKLKRPRFGIDLISKTWLESVMITLLGFLQLAKDLFQ